MDPVGAAPSHSDGPSVGAVLRTMRRNAQLTGKELGDLVEMSQSKISRLESGKALPDPEDVRRVAEALGADEQVVLRLMDQAELAHNRMLEWGPTPPGLAPKQSTVSKWEDGAREVRVFQPAVVIGLLQTSEYARGVMSSFQALANPEVHDPAVDSVPLAVSARIARQSVLSDQGRTFHFVMTETVLSNRLCAPEAMLGQLRRIGDVSRQDNVTIGFVPSDAELDMAPYHGFELMDDDTVLIDLYNTGLRSRGRLHAHTYRQLFDGFAAKAVTDIGPILEKYRRRYVAELQ